MYKQTTARDSHCSMNNIQELQGRGGADKDKGRKRERRKRGSHQTTKQTASRRTEVLTRTKHAIMSEDGERAGRAERRKENERTRERE